MIRSERSEPATRGDAGQHHHPRLGVVLHGAGHALAADAAALDPAVRHLVGPVRRHVADDHPAHVERRGARANAVWRLWVNTPACSPYAESLTAANAAASSLTRATTSTGPKTSSAATFAPAGTPVSTVGA